jgi:hypothetical protein
MLPHSALIGSLAATLFLFGCQQLPAKPRGQDVQVVSAGELEKANPNDIAIAPIRLAEPTLHVPEQLLREAFQHALLQRRYSPLALEAVDRRVIDASYKPGELREDAVLEITVERWKSGPWNATDQIDASVGARLVDARDSGGAVLWEGKLDRVLRGMEVTGPYGAEPATLGRLCDLLAADLLAALPPRSTGP